MRLRKIKIRNIASLRGDHVVDFDEIQRQSALFAITGETGAGKSTILNSIGLALYGKYFKKSIIGNDVVTLGEREGSVELHFELKGTEYVATWRLRTRKNNGEELKTTSAERGFYRISGESREAFEIPIEEVLSLDFEQFTKCVVLNQGEFAKFLSSSFADRRSILEKLCPGQVFDQLTSELNREMKVHTEAQRDLLNSLKTLQEEGPVESIKEEDLKNAREDLELKESWLFLLEKLGKKFETLTAYFQQNSDYRKRITETSAQIAAHTTSYNKLLKETEDTQRLRDGHEAELKKREPRLHELMAFEEGLSKDRKILERLLSEKANLEREFSSGGETIKKLLAQEKELSLKKKDLEKDLQFPYTDLLSHRAPLETAFSLVNTLENLSKDIEREKEKLKDAQDKGTELALELKKLKERFEEIPEDLPARVKRLEEQKQTSEKARLRMTELEAILAEEKPKLTSSEESFKVVEEKRLPLLANLKIQELLSAVSVCVLHPETEEKGTCPVCDIPFVTGKLEELKIIARKFNARKLREDEEKLRDEATRLKAHIDLLSKRIQENEAAYLLLKKIPEAGPELLKDLEHANKLLWEKEELLPRKIKQEAEVEKARKAFASVRDDLKKHEMVQEEKKTELSKITSALPESLPFTNVDRLRSDLSVAHTVSNVQSQMNEVTTKLEHLKERSTELAKALKEKTEEEKSLTLTVENVSAVLKTELGGGTAVSLHQKLKQSAQSAREEFENKETARRDQEKVLRDFQRNLTIYQEQTRELEILYAEAHSAIRNLMSENQGELSPELSETKRIFSAIDLPLSSPEELFIPMGEFIEKNKSALKASANEARNQLARLQSRKDEQEKRKDRIQGIQVRLDLVNTEIQRWDRLTKILGKDELRTFVLSLVEENLIIVTNEELARLCQGRYEIVHQTKSNNTPEFFILDKLRDGGIRKISTLSGGETFMVSLAMALGLAEMTRGTAEIDTLFIDEGFGTLDQDSLEDVLDMLNQIQNRGLMVGIISHVKALTSTLPVNLHVQKRQDGTSTVRIVVN